MPQFLSNIDLTKNELQNVRIQNLASHPTNPVAGQVYFNTTDNVFYGWSGTAWINLSLVVVDGASNGTIKINGVETTIYTHPGTGTNPHGTTKADVGLGSVENKSSATIRSEITISNVTTALGFTPVKDGGSTPELRAGTEATRPAATGTGMVYFATDTKKIWKDTASGTWTQMGGQDSVAWSAITGKPSEFTPPIASPTVLGGIKVGANLTVASDGTLNANDNPASFIRKQERFTVANGQTVFNLTKGTYKTNSGAITWFLNGDKQDDRALTETSSTSVTLPIGLPTGSEVLFEYYEVINWHPFPGHAGEHLTGGADPIPLVTTTTDGLARKEDKAKLDGIEAGAEVNDPAFKTIAVSGQSSIVADTDADTLTFVAGSNVTITTNATSDSITIAAKDTIYGVATTGADGLMSSGDKSKLDGIETGANNYSHPTGDGNLHVPATGTTNNGKVLKSGGTPGSAFWGTLTAAEVGALPSGGTAAAASKLATARTITLSGDVTGSATFDGAANISITATVGDDSHNHVISNVDGLQSALDAKETPAGAQSKADAALASAQSYTDTKVAALVDAAPGTLDTLNELAAALGDDPNFATTITTQIAKKITKASANIGDGTATQFTVTHNLNTVDLTASLREVSTNQLVICDIQTVDVNSIKLLFATAPTLNQYRITVTG